MTATCREVEPGVFVITPAGVGAARLFGAFFAAPGVWLLYQFLGGVLHPAEMTVFGWILLPIMAAVFLVPAWILLFGKKRTRLDTRVRTATEEHDLLVYTRRTTTAIPADAHVRVRVHGSSSSSDTTTSMIHVSLDPRGHPILLALFGLKERAEAAALAQQVASLLAIDVRD
jgi:hypothetical protein